MSAEASETVRRRRVFYVPGYDPFPPRRYRELYRKEGAEQAAISGYALAMRPAGKEAGGYGWRVETEIGGQRSEALVSVLVWSDLVQESMTRGIAGTYLLLARTLWFFLASGALAALARLRPGSMIAAFWPVVLLMGQLLAGLLAGGAVWALLGLALGLALPGGLAQGLGALAGAAVLVGVLRAFRKRDGRFYAYYMLYDFAHMAAWRGAWPEDLSARLSAYADQVLDALSEGYDEVLIVGHSSGAALAVSLAAEVERRGLPAGGPRWRF